ncbi:PD-(D/E)XK nuclease family protein [Paenibacillus mesophilus]|uniref:PD-(D/E)XK nuclease family protein n=1 Tax=Paenibacillus mesophilus TaxID=2582849 RepID=UPI00110F5F98|nr:PD-(D/E)XK nuclease family protein [Paenibacillus mesophilus]TMV45822.1 PD-(D/E)XK nuclease family protein [Paenibacillus mesophilus]
MAHDLVRNVHELLQRHPLSRKVLICDHFAAGNMLLEQICGRYGQVLLAEVQTMAALALREAEFGLFRQGLQFAGRDTTFWIVHHLMGQLAKLPDPYMTGELLTPGTVRLVHEAVTGLREAAVRAETLAADAFVDERKGRYVRELLARYERYLERHALVDFAGVLPHIGEESDDAVYLIGESLVQNATRYESLLLERIAGGRLLVYPDPLPFLHPESGFPAKESEQFHAVGATAEVREVFRRLLASGTPLDRTEIAASDYNEAAGIVHSVASLLDVPCTFAEGLPIEFSGTGRAALQALDWLEGGCPVRLLCDMLREGVISFRSLGEDVPASEWIRVLETCGIGWGKERYLLLLDPRQVQAADKDAELKRTLYGLFRELFTPLSDGDAWSPRLLLDWLARFLDRFANSPDEQESAVRAAVKKAGESLRGLPEEVSDMAMEQAVRYAKAALAGIRVRTSPMPVPGAVHVASLSGAGWSGRDNTYVIGADERSWATAARQNPVLLDEERVKISPYLPTSGELAKRARNSRYSRIGAIRGRVTFSYCSYSLSDGKSASPAFELLHLFRIGSGLPAADFSELRTALGQPAGYWGANGAFALDEGEAWTNALSDRSGRWKDGRAAMERAKPSMRKAGTAAALREQAAVSEYDGVVSGERWDVHWRERHKRSISASQLERYAECPQKYYYGYVLGLWPKDGAEFERTKWLQPTERGNMLHRIFYEYMRTVTNGGSDVPKHDAAMLESITDIAIADYERSIPAPSAHILRKECLEIRDDVELFFKEELKRSSRPRFFEQELSIDGKPMEVRLGEELSLRLKGFVDRIDETAPHEYRIIDYKTGSSSKYRDNAFFAGGTQLQHALYAAAAEQWLRLTGIDAEARVTESAYIFPTMKGAGREVVRVQNKRQEPAQVVRSLLASMERGLFVPTGDASRCRRCDYNVVCGAQAERMAVKRNAPANSDALRHLLEVEAID